MTPYLLAAISARSPQRLAAGALPAKPLTADSAARVEVLFGDGIGGRPPPQPDISALWKRLDAAQRSGDYAGVPDRDWRDAPWCLWRSEGAVLPLADRAAFARQYGQWIEGRQRKGDYRRLIQAWLLHFNGDNPPRSFATLITRACAEWPEWLWAQRHQAHDLFDVENGPVNLAGQVLDETRPVRDVLRDHGLGEWLQTGGYAEAAFAVALTDLSHRLRRNVSEARGLELVRRALEWAESGGGDLQFPHRRAPVAEALLLPWRQSSPPKAVERTITAFLLKTFRDPRMQPTRWNGVDDAATNVFRRWLTGATLEAFVRVIEQVAEQDHWAYRKAFWMAYYGEGHVLDAWVVLGPEAKTISRQVADLKGQSAELIKPLQPNHSVLLLRIGDLVVADWSHNGKCRVWREGDRRAPKLYRARYEAGDLRAAADFEVAHHGSSTGAWQQKIHDHIRDLTGIRLSPWSYMPNDRIHPHRRK